MVVGALAVRRDEAGQAVVAVPFQFGEAAVCAFRHQVAAAVVAVVAAGVLAEQIAHQAVVLMAIGGRGVVQQTPDGVEAEVFVYPFWCSPSFC
ncbi:hypothetical protein Cv017_12150 [Chromobacterium subtsugae]|nr:hypothetical protein Cv017_12150 [Chromobacterium subtsugae]